MFERSAISSQAGFLPTQNLDITSYNNLTLNQTRLSMKAGYSQIHYDEKTEKFEEQFDDDEDGNNNFVIGLSMPSNKLAEKVLGKEPKVGMILDSLYR